MSHHCSAPQGVCSKYLMQALPPQRTRPITMLTSNFSHSSLLHLGINMLAFWGFGYVVARVSRPHAAAVHARVARVAGQCPVAGVKPISNLQVAAAKMRRSLAEAMTRTEL